MFIGRESELAQLQRIGSLKKASLIVCKGRRRIGKSRLIEEYGKTAKEFLEIQGLAPRQGLTNQDQLNNFAKQFADETGYPELTLKSWEDAFRLLAKHIEHKDIVVLLDEISWMGSKDLDFPGKLKIAWDTQFKKNSKIKLVICGSVSSWIDQNIINSTDFLGRISLVLTVPDLPLSDSIKFFGKRATRISALEKFRILSVTGGVPRYLEEIDFKQSAEKNLFDICFTESGLLFNEFKSIFQDIFDRRATNYRELVSTLVDGPKNFSEICEELKLDPNGAVSNYLSDLTVSGFLRKDMSWSLTSGKSSERTVQYRLVDNYLRFFLKYIAPNAERIKKGIFKIGSLDNLPGYESIMGLQFENLVLNNLRIVLDLLSITSNSIVNAGSYFQRKSKRKAGCQIDLLIQTKSSLYVCEIKFRKRIGTEVVDEVKGKIKALNASKHFTIRPVLIYVGELSSEVEELDYFDQIIDFDRMMSPT